VGSENSQNTIGTNFIGRFGREKKQHESVKREKIQYFQLGGRSHDRTRKKDPVDRLGVGSRREKSDRCEKTTGGDDNF